MVLSDRPTPRNYCRRERKQSEFRSWNQYFFFFLEYNPHVLLLINFGHTSRPSPSVGTSRNQHPCLLFHLPLGEGGDWSALQSVNKLFSRFVSRRVCSHEQRHLPHHALTLCKMLCLLLTHWHLFLFIYWLKKKKVLPCLFSPHFLCCYNILSHKNKEQMLESNLHNNGSFFFLFLFCSHSEHFRKNHGVIFTSLNKGELFSQLCYLKLPGPILLGISRTAGVLNRASWLVRHLLVFL